MVSCLLGAGAHADIGGGYKVTTSLEGDEEEDDNAGLQWITQKRMLERFERFNLFAAETAKTRMEGNAIPDKPVLERGELHDGFLNEGLFNKFGLHWRRQLRGDNIHCSVLKRLGIPNLPKPLKGAEIGSVYRPENIYQSIWMPNSEISEPFKLAEIREYYNIINDRKFDCSE